MKKNVNFEKQDHYKIIHNAKHGSKIENFILSSLFPAFHMLSAWNTWENDQYNYPEYRGKVTSNSIVLLYFIFTQTDDAVCWW